MDDTDWLAERFEEQRAHLRAVAYRMLGSQAEADDAVQNSWLRLSGADTSEVENLAGWLTTVVARECLKMLRSRRGRREEPLADAVIGPLDSEPYVDDPEVAVLLADAVGPALMVVLDTLAPAERPGVHRRRRHDHRDRHDLRPRPNPARRPGRPRPVGLSPGPRSSSPTAACRG
jgi:DNA-directed RNA polymerase specialized sigma24 family protein